MRIATYPVQSIPNSYSRTPYAQHNPKTSQSGVQPMSNQRKKPIVKKPSLIEGKLDFILGELSSMVNTLKIESLRKAEKDFPLNPASIATV